MASCSAERASHRSLRASVKAIKGETSMLSPVAVQKKLVQCQISMHGACPRPFKKCLQGTQHTPRIMTRASAKLHTQARTRPHIRVHKQTRCLCTRAYPYAHANVQGRYGVYACAPSPTHAHTHTNIHSRHGVFVCAPSPTHTKINTTLPHQ